jgi:hypothetical protein
MINIPDWNDLSLEQRQQCSLFSALTVINKHPVSAQSLEVRNALTTALCNKTIGMRAAQELAKLNCGLELVR